MPTEKNIFFNFFQSYNMKTSIFPLFSQQPWKTRNHRDLARSKHLLHKLGLSFLFSIHAKITKTLE